MTEVKETAVGTETTEKYVEEIDLGSIPKQIN